MKFNLIAWISQLSDNTLISFLEGLRMSQAKGDWWDDLSSSQKKQVLKAIKEADKGNLHSSGDFRNKLHNA